MARPRKGVHTKRAEAAPEVRVQNDAEEFDIANISSARLPVRRKPPKEVKIGRDFMTRQEEIETQLFDALDDVLAKPEMSSVVIGGVTKTISGKLLRQVFHALGQVLSNDSYKYSNEKEHTGIAVQGEIKRINEPNITLQPQRINEKNYYHSQIRTSLRELAKLAFGVDNPTGEQYKEVNKTLIALQNEGLQIKYQGTEVQKSLLWVEGRTIRNYKTQEQELSIVLNPLFAMNAAKNYALHPQDANRRIAQAVKQPTEAHYILRDILAMQDKRKPFRIYITTLLQKLDLIDEYKKNKKRVMESKLPKLFQAMVDIKLIEALPTLETGFKGELEYKFILDKKYAKPLEE